MHRAENVPEPVPPEQPEPSIFAKGDLGAGIPPGPVTVTYLPVLFEGVESESERKGRHIEVHAIFTEVLTPRGYAVRPLHDYASSAREFTYSYSVSSHMAGQWQKQLLVNFGTPSSGIPPWWRCNASIWHCEGPELWPFAGFMLRAVLTQFPSPIEAAGGEGGGKH